LREPPEHLVLWWTSFTLGAPLGVLPPVAAARVKQKEILTAPPEGTVTETVGPPFTGAEAVPLLLIRSTE